jgi:hypothetical protein
MFCHLQIVGGLCWQPWQIGNESETYEAFAPINKRFQQVHIIPHPTNNTSAT